MTDYRLLVEKPQINVDVDLGWGWGRYEWPGPDVQELFAKRGLCPWMVRGFQIGPFRIERRNPDWPR